jgi:hypothetical protein
MLEDVQKAKSDLEAAGVDISGPNAIRITNLVAYRLGYGLLYKEGGSRAVLYDDGSQCRWGDDVRQPGFAVDYVIDPRTKFGFDILGDGGGANNPQWPGAAETAFVDRNTRWYRDPTNPATYFPAAAPPRPDVVVAPPVAPPVVPPVDDEVKSLLKEINENVKANTAELQRLREEVKNAGKSLAGSGLVDALLGGKKHK